MASRTQTRSVTQAGWDRRQREAATMDHAVRSDVTRRFIAALRTVEQRGDTDMMAQLFTQDAVLLSIDGHGPRLGPDGAVALFTNYRQQFDTVNTTFTQVTEGDGHAALEWSTNATQGGGHPVHYTGITVIDLTAERSPGSVPATTPPHCSTPLPTPPSSEPPGHHNDERCRFQPSGQSAQRAG